MIEDEERVMWKGNLRYTRQAKFGSGNYWIPTLVRCPVCGYEFNHGADRTQHLLKEHTPEDFGL
jgi:hypothetical protein